MHNYYEPSIPHQGNGLAITLGDDELFGILGDLEPEMIPHSPERRMAGTVVGGQPRISKKSSKSTLRSRKSMATLKSPPLGPTHPTPLSNITMAQSAGAAAGPNAYAVSATFGATKPLGASFAAPAAAAAAHQQGLKTPIKQDTSINSPSTILARSTPRTVLYTQATASHSHAPSPTPATRLRSTGKVVAPASDRSPAKGVFEKPKAKSRYASPPVPDMNSAMSQFQVTLNGAAEAQPISVPKPPEKNMQPTSVVGVGASSAASMAARAARASAQQTRPQPQYYPQPNSMSANAGASSMNMSIQTRQNAQMASQMNARANAEMSMNASAASMRQQRRMNPYWPPQQTQHAQHAQHAQQAQARQMQQMQMHPMPSQDLSHHQAPQDIPQGHVRQNYRPPPQSMPSQVPSVPSQVSQVSSVSSQIAQISSQISSQPLLAPQYPAGSNLGSFSSEIGSYSPLTDIEAKSLTPPVFSPPVSRSSSIRSPMSEEQWLVENGGMAMPRAATMGTPPTPAFNEKVPEFDEFKIDWNEGGIEEQWDVWGFLK